MSVLLKLFLLSLVSVSEFLLPEGSFIEDSPNFILEIYGSSKIVVLPSVISKPAVPKYLNSSEPFTPCDKTLK